VARILYVAKLAVARETGLPIPSLAGQTVTIVKRGTTTPAAISEDEAGAVVISGAVRTVTAELFIPSFWVEPSEGPVSALGGGVEVPLESVEGVAWRLNTLEGVFTATLSAAQAAQIAAEAAASSASTAVRRVNGIAPDSTGNVNVAGGPGGGGGILTVAGQGPDGTGNVPLSAANVGAAASGHTHTFASKTGLTGVTGTPTSSTYLRGDGTWAEPPGGAGGGSVNSINGVTPDGSGNVTLNKGHLNLGAVDNTSDANKPVSGPTQTALDAKAADSAVVKLTGNQSVGGVKTFTSAPVVPDAAFTQAKVSGLTTALGGKVGSTTINTIWTGSQTAYDAIGSKDSATLYLVTGA